MIGARHACLAELALELQVELQFGVLTRCAARLRGVRSESRRRGYYASCCFREIGDGDAIAKHPRARARICSLVVESSRQKSPLMSLKLTA